MDIPNLLRVEEYLSSKLEVKWLEDKDLVEEFIRLEDIKNNIGRKKIAPAPNRPRKKKVNTKDKQVSKSRKPISKSKQTKQTHRKTKPSISPHKNKIVRRGKSGKPIKKKKSFIQTIKDKLGIKVS